MYFFTRSENVPGTKSLLRIGYPDHAVPDICLCTNTSLMTYIPLNSTIVRDALLNSQEILESMGLKVIDMRKAKEMVQPPKKVEPIEEIITEVKVVEKEPAKPKSTPKKKPDSVTEPVKESGDSEWS